MSGNNLCFNGVNGATGGYLLEPMSATQVVSIALGETIDSRQRKDLRRWTDIQTEHNFEAVAGIDPCKLEETGWGVIFAHNADPAIREALSPLLDLRKTQASIKDGAWYKEFKGAEGYRYGESNRDFLARHGVEASQPADPARGVPYYLLIVGSPEDIPFRFQYLLDVQYAVGRIWFETLDEYSQYARSVVAAETGKAVVGRKATFFGVQNADDPATFLSSTEMVKPLAVRMPARLAERESPAWDVSSFLGALATKDQLSKTLQGKDVPSLLFTASHGMGFPNGDPRQLAHQGALLCQDWPGPRAWNRAIPESHYFSADDVPGDANLQGLIAFHFACYGAGTPELDDFAHNNPRIPRQIAPKPFIAKLPRKLLAQGALAVVGHVERAWGYSFYWNRIGSQLQTFESTLYEVMEGKPIGRALEFFNTRYAALATELSTEIEEINKYGKQLDEQLLAGSWTAHNDARSYVILGDPAVRLPLSKPGQSVVRPEITRAIPGGFEIGPPGRSPQITQVAHVSSVMSATDETPSELLDQIQATEHRILAEPPTRVAFDVSSRGSAFRSANDPARLESRMRDLGFSDAMIERFVRSDLSFGHVETVIPIDELNPDDRILERILGRNDMVDAPRFLLRGASAAQATGRVRLLTVSGGLRGWGTGSLIAPRLLLTNNHVLGSISHAESALLEFNVQDGTDGKPMKQVDFQLKPSEFFITDKNLDFTLVAVAEKSTDGKLLKEFGFNPGSLDDDPILVAESVNIVQHPSGRPKQIALRENTVTRMLTDFIHYQADTEPGSSGSPVFNDQWDLVALHHSGVPRRDSQGNILARDGSIWKPAMGDNQIDWIANEGVRISRILNFVRRFKLTGAKALQLHKELFEKFVKSSKKKISGSPEISPVVSSTVTPEGSTSSLSSTVSIPLTLNITLDIKGASGPILASVSSSPSGATTPAIVQQDEAISIDPDYDSREGYDPDFLGVGALRVDRPKLSATQIKDAARLNDPSPGADRYELKYHHYSVVMNRKRRLAFYTAVNIDGKKAREIKRETDKWFFDSRIPKEQQIGEELYSSNPFDRGHLVRRLDPAWGNSVRLVKIANDDTFHFTNCSPQHEKFNQGKNLWQGVENFLLSRAMDSNQKLTVFTGPVFRAKDPDYRGVQIPLEYWKVAVLVGEDGKLTSVAFLVTQADLIESVVEEGAIDVARMFQTSVRDIERLTGLNFGRLRNFDSQSVDSFSEDESQLASSRIPIESLDRIRIVGLSSSTGSSVEFGTPPSSSTGSSNSTHGQAKQTVIGTDLSYYLLSYDANSKERQDHPGCLVSQRIFDALDSEPKWYPRATWIAGQLEFSAPEVPLYGAVGAYGIRGSGLEPLNLPMRTVDTDYPFAVGRIYNLDGSNFINQGGGISGAHSDIQKPQVAHAVWNNVMGS